MKWLWQRLRFTVFLIFLCDLVFAGLLYLSRPAYFAALAPFALLFSLLLILAAIWHEERLARQQAAALKTLLEDPDATTLAELLPYLPPAWEPMLKAFVARSEAALDRFEADRLAHNDYRDYVEAWLHELKTPLSLAKLLIGNRAEEMSPYVLKCLRHIEQTMSAEVEQVLYYARLQSSHPDELLEKLDLLPLCAQLLEDFGPQAAEQGVSLALVHDESNPQPVLVLSDQRVLNFILAQLLSNALKYSSARSGGGAEVQILLERRPDERVALTVRDNGHGVLPADLPFIFEKGFTGMHRQRLKASGLGLYFVKTYAERLGLTIELPAVEGGFALTLLFPAMEG